MKKAETACTLPAELRDKGIVIDDLGVFWETAQTIGTLPGGTHLVYDTLAARYNLGGQACQAYQKIADKEGVSKEAVWKRIERALEYMTHPQQVVRYGRYVDVATIAQQPELMEA